MSADTINKVIFGGRLGADAEIRYTAEGKPVMHARMVVANRKREDGEWVDDPMWFRLTAFGRLAERYQERPLLKGNRIVVVGRLDTPHVYTGERGTNVSMDVVADEIARYDWDDAVDGEAQPQRPAARQQQPARTGGRPTKAADDVQDLEDLPF